MDRALYGAAGLCVNNGARSDKKASEASRSRRLCPPRSGPALRIDEDLLEDNLVLGGAFSGLVRALAQGSLLPHAVPQTSMAVCASTLAHATISLMKM